MITVIPALGSNERNRSERTELFSTLEKDIDTHTHTHTRTQWIHRDYLEGDSLGTISRDYLEGLSLGDYL